MLMRRMLMAAGGAAAIAATVAGCGTVAGTASKSGHVDWASVTSAQAGGGMAALVKAAKSEGTLTVIALPPNWANYGAIEAAFTKKYGIKIVSENPEGSSAQEVSSLKQLQGTSREPDVVDVAPQFAVQAQQQDLLAPYQVASWSQIPSAEKASNGTWYYDYGGYISIGYNASLIHQPPQTFQDLLQSQFHGGVGLDGNPTDSGAAFAGVFAAALSNGGSFSNVSPGIQFFKELAQKGNYVPVFSTAATIASGQVRASIDWSYLNAAYAQALKGRVDWKVLIPSSAHYAAYYAQAISKSAPHPAAARLWEEFLYSPAGQNLWLQGYALPVLLPSMIKDHTVNKTYLAAVPSVSGVPQFPTPSEVSAAEQVVLRDWPSVG